MALSKEKHLPQLAGEYECTACLACENTCPKQAINHYLADDGHVYVKVDSQKCIGCLKCQDICEKSRSCYGKNDLSASKLYAGWTENAEDRANATSGGVFAALARTILESGGCVIGAKLNGFECKHIVIYSVDDIHWLQGSKYMASSMEDVYKIIKRELPNRDVLFAGLGCQCAGVLSVLPEINTSHKLYTIDLVCGGIPSRILIDRFKEEYPEAMGIVSFRTKDKYELKVQTDSGEMTLKEKSLPLHGFNCGMTNRYNCYDCQFAKAHRKTDITIGDLWDYSVLPDEHKRGVSMIIVHSKNGHALINTSAIEKENISWDGTLFHNKRIVCGHQNIYLPRKKLFELSKKMNPSRFKKLYTISMSAREINLFLFRIIRYVNERILSWKNKKKIIAILNQRNKLENSWRIESEED